jgi:hypothetical protein
MRCIVFTIALFLITSTLFGQLEDNYSLSFDDTISLIHLKIDTISNPINIWKVGTPQKPIFTSASSVPNAIVTGLNNPYPINDTSVFIITNVAYGRGFMELGGTVTLEGEYYVNSDTLTDFGKIEFSPDNGINWIDLINDTILIDTLWQIYWYWEEFSNYPKPTLNGKSNGWNLFWIELKPLGHLFGAKDGDTILYRFTFISDSFQTNKDGLMFDNLHFNDHSEGFEELNYNNIITIFPNPASSKVTILLKDKDKDKKSLIQIFDVNGQCIYYNDHFQGLPIDTENLVNGTYIIRYSNSNRVMMKKLIVFHQ